MFVVGYFVLVLLTTSLVLSKRDEDEDPYTTTDPAKREPTPCEICKFFVTELKNRLEVSGKSKEVLETGHGLDSRHKKRFKYATSELRLTEALHEPHICEKILEYNVHAERKGSLRYAKGMSETFQTLHGLVNKGVKVELGIPYELWDKPSAEVSKMHRACFKMAEDFEEYIEDWYFHHQTEDLVRFVCADRVLQNKDQKCLEEVFLGKEKSTSADEYPQSNKKEAGQKGDEGTPKEEL